MTDSIKSSTASQSPLLKVLQKGIAAYGQKKTSTTFAGSKDSAAVDVNFSPQARAMLDKAQNSHALAEKLSVMDSVLKGRTSIKSALKVNSIQDIIAKFTK